jgi:hypothetical protein
VPARAISLTPQDCPQSLRAYRKVPSVSEMPASSPGSLLCGLHHRFLHPFFACPIQADLVAIGVVEVGMPPTPRRHAWHLGDVKPLFAGDCGRSCRVHRLRNTDAHLRSKRRLPDPPDVMRSYHRSRCAQARIYRLILIAEVFDELAFGVASSLKWFRPNSASIFGECRSCQGRSLAQRNLRS